MRPHVARLPRHVSRSDSPPAKTSLSFEEVLKPWVRPVNTFLGFREGPYGLLMCYTPQSEIQQFPWILVQNECRPNLDLLSNAVRLPVCPAQTRHQLRGIVLNAWRRDFNGTRGQFRSDRQRRSGPAQVNEQSPW